MRDLHRPELDLLRNWLRLQFAARIALSPAFTTDRGGSASPETWRRRADLPYVLRESLR